MSSLKIGGRGGGISHPRTRLNQTLEKSSTGVARHGRSDSYRVQRSGVRRMMFDVTGTARRACACRRFRVCRL